MVDLTKVSLLFPTVLLKSLDSFSFLPFAIFLAIFFAFVFLFLPETKGKQVRRILLWWK